MRNYERDIEELHERVEALELENLRLRRERAIKKRPFVKDKDGTIIRVGDWIKTTTPGKFKHEEGEVEGWKKWVTFVDITGVKQVRAPHNLLVCNDERKRTTKSNSCALFRKR